MLCMAVVAAAQTPSALTNVRPIGTGLSQAKLSAAEQTLFEHNITDGTALLNHFWAAGSAQVDKATFRYYIDGEATPSIVFQPPMACGVGFGDQAAPWGTKWMGKGAKSTGWFHNFQIPFKSVRVTYQGDASGGTIWMIIRGSENLPLKIGSLDLPSTARMQLQAKTTTLDVLEFYDLAHVPSGPGLLFMSAMAVKSGNYNFMEGCFHLYSPPTVAWPGLLMSTGMEDYYDSAFYFNGGVFRAPVSGSTHMAAGEWSGYRFHEMDPIVFSDGVRLQWRNGDVTDTATGLKCTLETGGKVVGHPTASNVTSYAWVYTW